MRRTAEVLGPPRPGDAANLWFNKFLMVLIALNVVALILESITTIRSRFGAEFAAFEIFSVAVFTVEYALRIWSAPAYRGTRFATNPRLAWAVSPLAIIDLLAILPFYLPLAGLDLRFLRSLRMLRVFRMLKIARYSTALQTFGNVFTQKKAELLVIVYTLGVMIVCASSAMYFIEGEAQPETFGSIPEAMWWSVVTLTTIGYGDAVPATPLGQVVGSIIAILGIGMFALPAGLLGSAFSEEVARQRMENADSCPGCGRARIRSTSSE